VYTGFVAYRTSEVQNAVQQTDQNCILATMPLDKREDYQNCSVLYCVQGWHGKFYPLGKTGWVKLGKKVSFTHQACRQPIFHGAELSFVLSFH